MPVIDDTPGGSWDGFVATVRYDGQELTSATYVGGSDEERVLDLAADGSGRLYITGDTRSPDFPATSGAFDAVGHSSAGGEWTDVFLVRLDTTASTLTYGTYLGGSGRDFALSVAVDANGAIYLGGYTESSDFPTTEGAFDAVLDGDSDGFVVKLTAEEPVVPLDCAGAAGSVAMLWPPNHHLMPVSVVGVVGASSIEATGVVQDEPTDDSGDGATCPDAVIGASGAVELRAERSGRGDGRVYEITFVARHGEGETCTASVVVCVPHDQGGAGCGEGDALHDSLDCSP
jgi:hypothetical protein